MKRHTLRIAMTLSLALTSVTVIPALAHRPYFEEQDIGPEEPWPIDDPTVSTALYATLESAADVDYYAFEGERGQIILLELTIPQIVGQEEFAPSMALIGPGLPATDELPTRVTRPEQAGAHIIPAPAGPAPTFFEPFSRTSYWERQGEQITLPADGTYVLAVWHPDGDLGRYVFVIGDKERPGGDLAFPVKMQGYWTPVTEPRSEPRDNPTSIWGRCPGHKSG